MTNLPPNNCDMQDLNPEERVSIELLKRFRTSYYLALGDIFDNKPISELARLSVSPLYAGFIHDYFNYTHNLDKLEQEVERQKQSKLESAPSSPKCKQHKRRIVHARDILGKMPPILPPDPFDIIRYLSRRR